MRPPSRGRQKCHQPQHRLQGHQKHFLGVRHQCSGLRDKQSSTLTKLSQHSSSAAYKCSLPEGK